MGLTPLQERVAALVAGLPEADGFILAGGAALAAHGLLDRATRDLDFFGRPEQQAQVHLLAAAFERACREHGLVVRRERDAEAFMRLTVEDGTDSCEVDIAIDYRALDPVDTRLGPTFDLRELGANKVLAIFDRAAPRDFVDLAELAKRFPIQELIELAAAKDPGLDLEVLDVAMRQINRIPPERLGVGEAAHGDLVDTVEAWRASLRRIGQRDLGRQAAHRDKRDEHDLEPDL